MNREEVLVVGAGPVGLTMAAELTRHGVPCRIIDQHAAPAHDTRAAALHARTLEIFENMGILPEVLKEGIKVTRFNLYSKKHRLVHTEFTQLDTPHSFILDLPQWQTEQILIKQLEKLGIQLQRNTTLTHVEIKEDRVSVRIKLPDGNTLQETFSYVIGCDGARSTCRHLTEIPFPGSEYSIEWIVFDAKIHWAFDSEEMHLFLHEKGLIACFPLPHNRMRIVCEVHLDRSKIEKSVPTLDLARSILQERVTSNIELEEPTPINSFIIHHRQAMNYREGRLFLAGDAAHLHSPAGGQGMNTGIQDAYNLAWKLALVITSSQSEELE